jgi:hypothetical protein
VSQPEIVNLSNIFYSNPHDPLEDVEALLVEVDKPSRILFLTVTYLAILSIRENSFDEMTMFSLGLVVAVSIFQDLFKGFEVEKIENLSLPPLFPILWDLHTSYDLTVLPRTIAVFQDPEYPISDVSSDQWFAFVKEASLAGRQNFTGVFGKIAPIPMNVTTIVQGFPLYAEFV